MIKLSDYDRLYRHTFAWVLSRIEPKTLKFYGDNVEDWIEALRAFEKDEVCDEFDEHTLHKLDDYYNEDEIAYYRDLLKRLKENK